MYGHRNKLVCLFRVVCLSKPVKRTDNRKDTSLLRYMSIFHRLRIRYFYSTGPWSNCTAVEVAACLHCVFFRFVAKRSSLELKTRPRNEQHFGLSPVGYLAPGFMTLEKRELSGQAERNRDQPVDPEIIHLWRENG
jgi:hypothetical protein